MKGLPNEQFQILVTKIREKDFYKSQQQRPIVWSKYNLTQIQDAKESLIKIRDSVNACRSLNLERQVGRPLTNPKSLAKAILFCELLGLPERQAQGWLEILSPFLGICEHLDDWVIGEAYNRPEVLHILKQVFDLTKTSDKILSGDGTWIETSRKQNYESQKTGGELLVTIVDSREIVQAYNFENNSERKGIKKIIFSVEGESLRLDAGFVEKELAKTISELGMKPFIFPKKNLTLNGNLAWKYMYLNLLKDVQEWLKEYHQRSHTESFHSSFKRVFGILTKIRPTAQLSQITSRIILHNRRRQSYFSKLA